MHLRGKLRRRCETEQLVLVLGAVSREAWADVRERSGQYAASLHLIVRALATRVTDQPAHDLYYHLVGRGGLATNDPTWAALLEPDATPGATHFVITSPAIGRESGRESGDAGCRRGDCNTTPVPSPPLSS